MSKEIQLTKGQVAIVDDDWYEMLSQAKWQFLKAPTHKIGYAYNPNNGYKTAWMHRIIMDPPKRMSVDHINHNTLDNRRENLRIVTHQQNKRNTQKADYKNATSRHKGVYYEKGRKKWVARITVDGLMKNLGRFPTEDEAGLAYNESARKIFGEHACLNEVYND